ncbi:ribokinase [Fictibacillus macauensis ZFHKF-1]|uniref:Ribokinase n=1 Tax=Fictibacillus macauensis ZFHKF-1 TaxID=1196324 RepID=I8AEJ3_9BACL|nr:ribokinase [Fictibacillus macauensis]EIT83992.1 ribokinase [Fictibacillus macauensis ZFHKF-1]
MKAKITVVGSINMDLVTISNKVPKMGETLLGQDFLSNPGGKGANQAVAAARLGADVKMVGAVGNDTFGKDLLRTLEKEKIDVSAVEEVDGASGTATILVSQGDNSIIVVPGANEQVTPDFVERHKDAIKDSDYVLLQLEIPVESVEKAVQIAKENDVKVILNPAPIQKLSDALLANVDYLTPNEHELELLVEGRDKKAILEKVIVTKGSEGLIYYEDGQEVSVPAFSVEVKDTTGAGDTFNGAFATALSEGKSLKEACLFGNAAGALSTTKLGAQAGMPKKEAVQNLVEKE